MIIRKCIALLLICSLLLTIHPETGHSAAATEGSKEKVRHRTTYIFDERQQQVTVRTTVISYDTGMKKVKEYDFTDSSLQPSSYRFTSTNGFNQQDGVVVDTPQGLKAYTLAYLNTGAVIYEYDYASIKLRKITEIKSTKWLKLWATQGLYSVRSDNGDTQYYSLVDNKRVLSNGSIITSQDVTDTKYSTNHSISSTPLGVYCPDAKFTSCFTLLFGGLKGSPVKVTKNDIVYDTKQPVSSKTFIAGDTKIKWTSTYKEQTYRAVVEGIRGGKTTSLFKGEVRDVKTFVSPNLKYLVLIADPSMGIKKTKASKVLVYDLKTLKQVRSYESLYRASVERIQWASDDLYVIDYYFSNPQAYPPSFYYIPEGKHFKIEYSQYRDWVNYWDSFSYEGMFFLTLPVAITSGEGVLRYNGQPTFYMNGLYYVPLEEFTNAFHIKYEIQGGDLLFERNSRTSKLAVSQSKQQVVGGKVYLPLGQWNKDLGLKVSIASKHVMNTELQFSDEERKTDAAMTPAPLAYRATVEEVKQVAGESASFVGTQPYETSNPDRAAFRNIEVVLNHNRTLRIRMQNYKNNGEMLHVKILSNDYSKVLMDIPVDMLNRYEATSTAIPTDVLDNGVATIAIPYNPEVYLAYKLQLPVFDPNRF
ncbi:hypothetical protein [Paenibacillus tundrae]